MGCACHVDHGYATVTHEQSHSEALEVPLEETRWVTMKS
jgi:hypothetical protein